MAKKDLIFGGGLAFLFGVLANSLNLNLFALILAAAILAAFLFLLRRSSRSYEGRVVLQKGYFGKKYLLFFFLFLLLGYFYFFFYFGLRSMNQNLIFEKEVVFRGMVANEPRFFEKYQQFEFNLEEPFKGKIKVLSKLFPEFNYGDILDINGIISKPDLKINLPESYFPEITPIGENRGFWLKSGLIKIKKSFIAQFRRNLPPDEAALASGLIFGYRSDFSQNFKDAMSKSGTTHLVALSGYNISILVLAIAGLFGWFLSRRLTFYLTLAVIFLFVMMVGTEPSVVRAALMGFLALLTKELGRLYNFRNIIILAALFMIILNPSVLAFDVGFQLSFLSLLGIVYVAPAIGNFLKFNKNKSGIFGLKETAVLTLGAQLAVVPVIIKTFGSFSITAIFANVLILEIVPFTMFIGFIAALIGFLSNYLGALVSWFLGIFLAYESAVIKIFAHFSVPVGNYGNWALFLIYYLILIIFTVRYFFHQNEREKIS